MSSAEAPATTTITVPAVKVDDLKNQGNVALKSASDLVIDCDEMYELAATELQTIKGTIKQLEEMRLAVSEPLHKAKTANDANFKAIKAPWEQAEQSVKAGMLAWVEKKEAEAAEERRKADELAAQARREAEAREAEARAAAQAAIAAAQTATDEEKFAEAVQAANEAEARAESFAMEAAIAAPTFVAAPRVAAVGTQLRGTWKAEVEDKLALLRHIVAKAEDNPDLLALVDINASSLNKRAKALEKNLNLPGVKAVFERSIAARSA